MPFFLQEDKFLNQMISCYTSIPFFLGCGAPYGRVFKKLKFPRGGGVGSFSIKRQHNWQLHNNQLQAGAELRQAQHSLSCLSVG